MDFTSAKSGKVKAGVIVGDPGVKIDTKSLKAEFHIGRSGSVIFSYSGFKTGIARGILLDFAHLIQGGQLFLKTTSRNIFWVFGPSFEYFHPIFCKCLP